MQAIAIASQMHQTKTVTGPQSDTFDGGETPMDNKCWLSKGNTVEGAQNHERKHH
jgi:hypothetical protein